MIEVMTCKGGCLGGGGEPKSDDPDILRKRAEGLYKIDSEAEVRQSHENQHVQQLYDDWLGEPLSHTAEQYLHATYAERGSPRDKLIRLLAAVDFRDGMLASHLFSENGVWNTNHHVYGVLTGREEISNFIKMRLPSIKGLEPGERRPRHLMLNHAEGTDVALPNGGKVHFDVILDDNGLIKYLSQWPIHDISIRTASNKYARE
jgi:NADH-quinone oxidoreductase subunit G